MAGKISRILIIDDDDDFAALTEHILRLEGFSVQHAGDSISAITKIRNSKPDLILLDILMPGGGGFSVCEKMRFMGLSIPVVILTSADYQDFREEASEFGIAHFLSKPLRIDALRSIVSGLESNMSGQDGGEAGQAGLGRVIMIIDSDEAAVGALCKVLRSQGFKVVWAPDCMQSVSKMRNSNPDLLLLEVDLPGENGFVIYDRLTQLGYGRPVVIHSRLDRDQYEENARQYGISHYLKKSCSDAELLTAIKTALPART